MDAILLFQKVINGLKKRKRRRAEWTILDDIDPQNNNDPQE